MGVSYGLYGETKTGQKVEINFRFLLFFITNYNSIINIAKQDNNGK